MRLAELRRLDDLAGGLDLAGLGAYRLGRAVRAVSGCGPSARRRLLPELAESAQLAEPARSDLLDVARDAFTSGVNVFGWVAAVVVMAAAVVIIATLKHVPPMNQDQSQDDAEAAEGAAVGAESPAK